jgi:hypothetical protein
VKAAGRPQADAAQVRLLDSGKRPIHTRLSTQPHRDIQPEPALLRGVAAICSGGFRLD